MALVRQADTSGAGTPIVVFNTLSWPRTDLATVDASRRLFLPCRRPGQPGGSPAKWRGRFCFVAREVPPLGFSVYRIVPGHAGVGNAICRSRITDLHAVL